MEEGLTWWLQYLRIFALNSPFGMPVKFTIGVTRHDGELVARHWRQAPYDVVDAYGIRCKQVQTEVDGKKQFDPLTGSPLTHEACDQLTVEEKSGTLTAEQFDEKVKNLVTFLAYSANPVKLESQRIGTYVLLYLAFFFVFAYLLKREYWKDVH